MTPTHTIGAGAREVLTAAGQRAARTLRLSDVSVAYGPVAALRSVDIEVAPGETVALLGRNGAGKSTVMKAVTGLVRVRSGSIRYGDVELHRLKSHHIVSEGIAHVPEGRRIFGTMTVMDNILLGGLRRPKGDDLRAEAARLLELFPLRGREHARGNELSGGQQQMVALARGMMAQPSLLLLDEPSLGLSPLLVQQTTEILLELRAARPDLTILIAEQNAPMALDLADRVYVLRNGRVVHHELTANLDTAFVVDAYLGSSELAAARPDDSPPTDTSAVGSRDVGP